jgi:hypothetical protein
MNPCIFYQVTPMFLNIPSKRRKRNEEVVHDFDRVGIGYSSSVDCRCRAATGRQSGCLPAGRTTGTGYNRQYGSSNRPCGVVKPL